MRSEQKHLQDSELLKSVLRLSMNTAVHYLAYPLVPRLYNPCSLFTVPSTL